MRCPQCSLENAAATGFCGRCGAKLDFTADEIAGALAREAKDETAAATEHYAKQAFFFSGALLILAVTLFVLSLGAPVASGFMPGISPGTTHADVEVRIEPELPRLAVPLEIRKR